MAALFAPPKAPAVQIAPPAPGMNDANIQKQADAETTRVQQQGRASTFLMSPQTRKLQENQQQYLGGI